MTSDFTLTIKLRNPRRQGEETFDSQATAAREVLAMLADLYPSADVQVEMTPAASPSQVFAVFSEFNRGYDAEGGGFVEGVYRTEAAADAAANIIRQNYRKEGIPTYGAGEHDTDEADWGVDVFVTAHTLLSEPSAELDTLKPAEPQRAALDGTPPEWLRKAVEMTRQQETER